MSGEQLDNRSVMHTKWFADGDVRARCQDCDWRKRSKSLSTVTAAAKRHVAEMGHRVERSRSQWSLTRLNG